jgi:hypothetical protein
MAEFEEKARQVLCKLGGRGRLKQRADGYRIVGVRGAKAVLPPPFVERLRACGWLRDEDDGLALSQAGEAWRMQADTDPFAAQHRVLNTRLIKDERGRDCYVVANAAESPLASLRTRGLVNAIQFEAGERLRRDFTIAQLTPRMGVDYSAPVGRGSYRPDIADTALAARQRFNRAMHAAGPGLSDVLFDVCCYLKGIEESEKDRNWPRSSAKVVLRIALDRLVEHYGMHAPRRARTRVWVKEEPQPALPTGEGGSRV